MTPENLLHFALGQLTERGRGKDFKPVYLNVPSGYYSYSYPCYHFRNRVGIADCKRECFILGVRKEHYPITLYIGTCPVCGVTIVLHPVESLKEVFSEQSPKGPYR